MATWGAPASPALDHTRHGTVVSEHLWVNSATVKGSYPRCSLEAGLWQAAAGLGQCAEEQGPGGTRKASPAGVGGQAGLQEPPLLAAAGRELAFGGEDCRDDPGAGGAGPEASASGGEEGTLHLKCHCHPEPPSHPQMSGWIGRLCWERVLSATHLKGKPPAQARGAAPRRAQPVPREHDFCPQCPRVQRGLWRRRC